MQTFGSGHGGRMIKTIVLSLFLTLPLAAEPMKVLVQWTQVNPRDWVVVESTDWGRTKKRPVPPASRGRPTNDNDIGEAEGWVYDLMVQGISFGGADHYAVQDLLDGSGGIRVTVWNDDPDDFPLGERFAEVWTLYPLVSDPRMGGAINTRQFRVVYAQANAFTRWASYPKQNTEVRPWSEFVPPPAALTRHGIWITNDLARRHDAAQSLKGWQDKEWADHLPASELDENGRVKVQRLLGRYNKPSSTITYFQRTTDLATGIHVADFELELNTTGGVAGVNKTCSVAAGPSTDECHVFTTLASNPNDADWPSGNYRCQINANQVMNMASFGFLTINAVAGHMARVNSGLTSDLETFEQIEPAFTGTGLKLATTGTVDPIAGAASDRFEGIVIGEGSSSSMAGSLRLQVENSDGFCDGPWAAAADDDLMVIQ